ncbi:low temperature requirement protein A [Streptomyces alkaliterrae]|uniref:Low temperature requirement protein A n=1 Tax=Streptomyces alkaliterrae TaxID=2213162 RepID=A0A5P0YUA3_9ACTN|nr:low temperature requirement protein A [Streptomyces alkaliterrae]MBB1261551.1 low temperature requirement protein A [Streptomyces alkaliterrae]MQS03894.1 low temperature requirement protein A [Streptomyces alkaliterrae]
MSDSSPRGAAGGRGLTRRLVPMAGRDPAEHGRTATPLELLFDLTFVVAVGTAALQFAEMLAAGHPTQAILAFVLAMFAIVIAWIGYTWFASAFGTDDWLYRALTMLQMIGVVVLALGIPAMFHSVEQGGRLELRVMVLGYLVMRVALVLQWWRVTRESPRFRKVGLENIRWTVVAQLCWVVIGFAHLPLPVVIGGVLVVGGLELLLPSLTQGDAGGTPWHPHHVAERYSLFAIIALGEGVVGTVASSGGLLGGADGTQWSGNGVAVVVAGIGLTFGMWWVYFNVPFGDVLVHRRNRGYLFGYGHIPLYIGIACAGAALHVAGLHLEHHSRISDTAVVLSLALPVGLYLLTCYLLYALLVSARDWYHLLLVGLSLTILAVAVLLAVAGVAVAVCLLVVMLAPYVTVSGYETVGHEHQRRILEDLAARDR